MAVSGGEVIVNVIAKTDQFQQGMAKAEKTMYGTAAAAGKVTAATTKLGNQAGIGAGRIVGLHNAMKPTTVGLSALDAALLAASEQAHGFTTKLPRTKFGVLGLKAPTLGAAAALLVGAQAFKHFQKELVVTGDEAFTTGGRIRNALASALKADIVGVIGAFDAQKVSGSVSELQAIVNAVNTQSGIVGPEGRVTHAVDSVFQLIGVDRERERQLKRLDNLSAAYAATINDKMITALGRLKDVAIDTGSALVFGERGGPEGRGPGAIANEVSKAVPKGPMVGVSQRVQTAIAAAEALGDKNGLIAQLNRANEQLTKQLKQKRLTDKQRQQIYEQIAANNSRIESLSQKAAPKRGKEKPLIPIDLSLAQAQAQLTAKTTDDIKAERAIIKYLTAKIAMEKDKTKKLEEVQALASSQAKLAELTKTTKERADLGVLGAGAFLSGEEMQRAQGYGYRPGARDYLKDIRGQISDFKKFQADLMLIRKKGGSAALIKEFQQQGMASAGLVGALAHSNLVGKYSAAFAEKERLSVGGYNQINHFYFNTKTEGEAIKKGLKQANNEMARRFNHRGR